MAKIEYKTVTEIGYMRRAGLVVAQMHAALREACKPGISTGELDKVSAAVINKNSAKSNFLGYYGYPATVCVSVNEEIIHGIPGERILAAGDLVSFDCGAYLTIAGKQWHGDAAFTMFVGEEPDFAPRDRELNTLTEKAMWQAIASLDDARTIAAVGDAVETVVESGLQEFGWEAGIVEEYVGHGIGTAMHQPPDVLNYRSRGRQTKIQTGLVLAIEPMLTLGTMETRTLADKWTVVTADGSRAAHWEHTVAILPEGISVLTSFDGGKAGLAPYGIVPVALS